MKNIENIVNNYMRTSSSQPALMSWEKLECRVKKYYELMREYCYNNFDIEEPFLELTVKYDIQKSMTKTYGYAKIYQWLLKFSYQLVDGRYNYKFTDDIIRHEIGHLLVYKLFGDVEAHGKEFHKIGEIFNYNAEPTTDDSDNLQEGFSKLDECKYCLECEECGHRYHYYKYCKTIKRYKHCCCHKCNGELKMIKGEVK